MALIAEVEELFSEWIASVTAAIDGLAGHVRRSRRILLDQADDGTLTTTAIASKGAPALAGLSFSLVDCRPAPPLPAEWLTAVGWPWVRLAMAAVMMLAAPSMSLATGLDGSCRAAAIWSQLMLASADGRYCTCGRR